MITLRELERSDLPTLNRWRNDPALMALLGNNFLFIAEAVDEAWFASYLAQRDRQVRLSIVEEGRYVGNVNLTAIHPINRSAEFSLMIGEASDRGRGIGAAATRYMLQHGFHDRGLNRIYLQVLKENHAAIHLYEKAGFKHEGVKRQEIFKNGQFHDMLCMAILRSDYQD
jgi:diamine N-acetyltransferase